LSVLVEAILRTKIDKVDLIDIYFLLMLFPITIDQMECKRMVSGSHGQSRIECSLPLLSLFQVLNLTSRIGKRCCGDNAWEAFIGQNWKRYIFLGQH
jgi:hypothetical protein